MQPTKEQILEALVQVHNAAVEAGKTDLPMMGLARRLKQELMKLGYNFNLEQTERPKGFLDTVTLSEDEAQKVIRGKTGVAVPAPAEAAKTKKEKKSGKDREEQSSELLKKVAGMDTAKLESEYGLVKLKVIAQGINATKADSGQKDIEIVDDVKALAKSIYDHFHPKTDA